MKKFLYLLSIFALLLQSPLLAKDEMPKSKMLLPKVNEVIRKMKKDGSLKKILAEYSM